MESAAMHGGEGAMQDLSCRAHRRLIGTLGFLLPFLLYLAAGLLHGGEPTRWRLLPSISAYYHTGAVGVFVGILVALAVSLLTYRGYSNTIADRIVAGLAGSSALVLALFPTTPHEGTLAPTWWHPWMSRAHDVSAVILFVAFILFSGWLFRKSSVPKGQTRPAEKRCRDRISAICAVIMGLCVLVIPVLRWSGLPILVPESVAIEAFAVSWLVKGKVLSGWCGVDAPDG
jgi:hypothetical protein